MSSIVCKICGASKSVQRCSCVSGSERTNCGVSLSDQRRACDIEAGSGTHFIIQNTRKKATSYQKGTSDGDVESPGKRATVSRQPIRVDVNSSWEPSPMPVDELGYTPEDIKKAIEKSYKKCTATKDVHRPQQREHQLEAPQPKVSSNFRSKRLVNRQVRTGRHRRACVTKGPARQPSFRRQ